MKKTTTRSVKTWFESAECQACGRSTNWGSLIAVCSPETNGSITINKFVHVCAACYNARTKT